MTVVVLASVKGSPGVTTAATALAAAWPPGRQVLLVEADPFGGDLAARYGSTVIGGLASLFAAARRTLTPDAVWAHVQPLPGGLPVLFGLTGVRQAMANENAWPPVAQALAGLDADVVVDAGRLLPGFAGGVGAVLEVADVLVVLSGATLESVVHLRDALPGVLAQMGGRRLLVVPTGSDGYPAADIARTLEVTVGPALPDDPAAAAALGNRRGVKRLERTRLLRWAAALVAELGVDAVPVIAPSDTNTDAVRGELPPGVAFDEPLPSIDELIDRPPELSSPERSPVGAGSKWEARP